MGPLRDAIGSAFGGEQVNTGLGGPKIPFTNRRRNQNVGQPQTAYYQDSQSPRTSSSYNSRPQNYGYGGDGFRDEKNQSKGYGRSYVEDDLFQYSTSSSPYEHPDSYLSPNDPPCYGEIYQQPRQQRPRTTSPSPCRSFARCPDRDFRPMALPQVEYGKGKPFLRGYSHELARYGISGGDFIRFLDKINLAVIPNPENQLFQKGANIAGWFIPGVGGAIGLMAGQIGVGVGAAFGHASMVAKVLSTANLELFIPNGLEVCICKCKDVDNETGNYYPQQCQGLIDPRARLASYGSTLAPLTVMLPPVKGAGRADPIAMLGQGMSNRSAKDKLRKAQEELQKGKTKDFEDLEKGLQWIMVRRASEQSREQWQKALSQSNQALNAEP